MRIAHIADVHVRNLSRHAEHRVVFEDFARQCKKQQVDHIFIGGDLFHAKTSGMSPECIEFMAWWLNELAAAAPVHIILGNHDLNVTNFTRQDAISPIVNAINNPRVHLYKKSGVYQFAPGHNWCIFSIFDEDGWKDVKPVKGEVNIACYHGPVYGAKTETDWDVVGEKRVEDFAEYDMCFLGDIHKTQHLDYREQVIEIDAADLSKHPRAEVVGS